MNTIKMTAAPTTTATTTSPKTSDPARPLWCRKLHAYLDRNLPDNRVAYVRAQARHPALQPYPTVLEAAKAAAAAGSPSDESVRDGIVGAIVAEFQAEPSAVWSAAAAVAMAPALTALVRRIRKTDSNKKDAPYCLLNAFYEGMRTISLAPRRIAFRLYSETRRATLRAFRVRPGDADSASTVREPLGYEADAEPELCLDAKRFVERARTMPPREGERPAAYLERVCPSATRAERLEREHRLAPFRKTTLAAFAKTLSAFSPTSSTSTEDGQ
jgi:hypothetical protein